MKKDHPYRRFEGHAVWKALDKGIGDLKANGDLEEMTARPYIVGYLSQVLAEAGLLAEPTEPGLARRSKSG